MMSHCDSLGAKGLGLFSVSLASFVLILISGSLVMAEQMKVPLNGTFTITLFSQPSTGHEWTPSYDKEAIEFVAEKYIPKNKSKDGKLVVGAGGDQKFIFRALREGETTITMTYRREWEGEDAKKREYRIFVRP
jgi:inhibitor of cysteine peptidase